MARIPVVLALLLLTACVEPAAPRNGAPVVAPAPMKDPTPAVMAPPGESPVKVAPSPAPVKPPAPAPPESTLLVSPARAATILWADDEPGKKSALAACAGKLEKALVRCLLGRRYADDPAAQTLALDLYDRVEVVAGLEAAYSAEFGYRGVIQIVPERPVGRLRRHLQWIRDGFAALDEVYSALERRAGKPLKYRWKGLELKFYRSVDRNTPSAYANAWYFGYNVNGSLLKSAEGVRDTLVHEIFHMNDAERRWWSGAALQAAYDGILTRCPIPKGGKWPTRKCLAPWAPAATTVKGGTYYAFQPGNDVHEYGAELGLRYFLEQREALAGRRVAAPFKCGNAVNAGSWALLVAEFFAGADAVPACKSPPK